MSEMKVLFIKNEIGENPLSSFEITVGNSTIRYENGMLLYDKPAFNVVVNGKQIHSANRRVRGKKS